MIEIAGAPHRYCSGITRRNFMRIGSLAMGGLSLPSVLQAEAVNAVRPKSVIMVYLAGGLSHHDTFDMKPNAPAEIRGEFKPIQTSVPGLQIGELLPRMSQTMHRVALIRSLVGFRDEHSSFQNMTGFPMDQSLRERIPNIGCVTTRIQGTTDPRMPAYVDLAPTMVHRPYNTPGSGYLGRASDGVKIEGKSLAVMKLNGMTIDQLGNRQQLRQQLDQFRKEVDGLSLNGMDVNYERAFNVLTSNKLLEALDITKEPMAIRDRYGHGSPTHLGDGAPQWNDQLLAARRLVEAGARFVSVAYGFWDTHGNNFGHLRNQLPLFDTGISALINDIHDRGLNEDVLVVVWGEFGRTPKINANAGRDHWAPVNFALLAGGGLNVGQVIGASDAQGAFALDRPIHFHDVFATMYESLGISTDTFVHDIIGRPVRVLPGNPQPIRELV